MIGKKNLSRLHRGAARILGERGWSLSRLEGIYVVLLGTTMMTPAFAGSTDLKGALDSLLTLLQAAGAGIIGLSILHWGIAYSQGNSHSREAFTHIGIGAGLILGAKALGAAI